MLSLWRKENSLDQRAIFRSWRDWHHQARAFDSNGPHSWEGSQEHRPQGEGRQAAERQAGHVRRCFVPLPGPLSAKADAMPVPTGFRGGIDEARRMIDPASMHVETPLRSHPGVGVATCLVLLLVALGCGPVGAAQSGGEHDNGLRVGKIRIQNGDVFDTERADENRVLYRLANRWHYRTRPRVIREALLFAEGDVFDPRLLEESARLLRTYRFLGEVQIDAAPPHDGVVDVDVRTRDVWSLNPGVSFGRNGGDNSYGFELQELNLLGRGIELDIDYSSNVDRNGVSMQTLNPHAFGAHNELELFYGDNSDGNRWRARFERPFYALDVRQAFGFDLDDLSQRANVYQRGEIVDQYLQEQRTGRAWFGTSAGLVDGWVSRWSVGLAIDRHRFQTDPLGTGAAPLPTDRDLRYPFLQLETIEDDYRVWENRNQIGRSEDVLLGTQLNLMLGWASPSMGSDREALIYRLGAKRGFPIDHEKTLLLGIDLSGRREGSRGADELLHLDAQYFHPLSERNLVFSRLQADLGRALSFDQRLLLGGDNGLRGFPLRYQGGDKRVLYTLEHRYFSDWYPFRLFRVGAAAFLDVGRAWGDDGLANDEDRWLSNIGVGLRLGNTRSALGSVVHIDLAAPLNRPGDVDSLQLVVEVRRAF